MIINLFVGCAIFIKLKKEKDGYMLRVSQNSFPQSRTLNGFESEGKSKALVFATLTTIGVSILLMLLINFLGSVNGLFFQSSDTINTSVTPDSSLDLFRVTRFLVMALSVVIPVFVFKKTFSYFTKATN